MKRLICLALIISMLISGVSPALAESVTQHEKDRNLSSAYLAPDQTVQNESTSLEEEYIIKYKDIKTGEEKLKKQSKQVKQANMRFSFVTAKLNKTDMDAISKDSNVAYIEKNHPVAMASDTIGYNLTNLHVPQVHQEGNQGDAVKVALLDTGIAESSDWNVAGGVSFVASEPDYEDHNGHGTAIASILAALPNEEGLLGVAPNIELYAVKVLDQTGTGTYSQVISALEWAVDNHMDIVSMSFTGLEGSQILKEAVDAANEAGILLIAAAGNGGMNTGYPARYESVVSVGAVDEYNQLAPFSNYGKIDVVAPGVNIPSTALNGTLVTQSGTSVAVPHVAGIAAMLKHQQPDQTGDGLRQQLQDTAQRAGDSSRYGYGVVDAFRAVHHEVDPTPPVAGENYFVKDNLQFIPKLLTESVEESVYQPFDESLVTMAADDIPDANMLQAIKNVNTRPDSAPFSISTVQEQVSTLTGGVSIQSADLTLPGRNGLSFTLSRTYRSEDSQLYDTDVERLIFCVARVTFQATMYQERTQNMVDITPIPNSSNTGIRIYDPSIMTNGTLNNVTDAVNYTYYLNQQSGKTWYYSWSGPDQSGFYTRNVLQFPANMSAQVQFLVLDGSIPIWRTTALGKVDEEKRFPIGKGWTWDIPYIKYKRDSAYLSLPGKGAYELVGTTLKGYPWKDLTIVYDSSVTVNGLTSNLVLKTLNGINYYFSGGNLIQISDQYQNATQFKYSSNPLYGNVLNTIVDAAGNSLSITYAADKVVLTSGNRTVTYNKSTYTRNNDLPPYNALTAETLQSVEDVQGRITRYYYSGYDAVNTLYDNSTLPKGKNPYLLLYYVSFPTGASTNYQYEAIPVTRYVGQNSSNQYATNQAYRLSNRYDNASGQYNKKQFTYTNPQGAITDVGTYGNIDHFYVNINDGLKTTTYDNKKVFIDDLTPAVYHTNQVTEKAGNTQIQTSYVYDTTRKLPVPNDTTTITMVGTAAATSITTSTRYDDYGNILSYTDPMGSTSTFTTDANHFVNSSLVPVDTGLSQYTEMIRDAKSGRILKQTVRDNNTSGTLRQQVEYTNLDTFGNVQAIKLKDDTGDIVVNVEYNSSYASAYPTAQSMQVKNADGQVSTIRQSATYYKDTGLMQSYRDGKSYEDGQDYTTSYTYDNLGRITQVSFPDNSTRTWTYDDTNNIVSSKDEVGNQVYTRWNPLGWKTEEGYKGVNLSGITYSLNGMYYSKNATYGYDAYGRMSWSKDALLQQTSYTYDPWGRLTLTRYVDGAESVTSYDDVSRAVTSQDPEKKYNIIQKTDIMGRLVDIQELGTSTNEHHSFEYNKLGLLSKQTDYPQAGVTYITNYSYDALGHISNITQPTQPRETIQYQYSLAGRLKKMIYPDGNCVQYGYDEAGRRITRSDPDLPMEKTYYDGNGNAIKTVDKNGATFTYDYNKRNLLLHRYSPDETVGYTYDTAGRRTSMTDLTGTTSYAYKPGTGKLQTVTYPDLRTISYTYNALGLRESMKDPFGYTQYYAYDTRNRLKGIGPSLTTWEESYLYYINNQLRTISRKNGITSTYTYDGPRLDTLVNGSTASYDYNYDGNGNISEIVENGVTSSYGYDALNRIASSSKNNESYTYDNRGNRLTMQSSSFMDFKETSYQYDTQNRLKQVTKEDGKSVSYSYNGDGMLVGRTENGATTRYYYDGSLITAEGMVNGSAVTLTSRYMHGGRGIAVVQTGDTNYYTLKNGHGDVTELRTSSGGVANQYSYDLWGNTVTTQETVKNPFRYSGEYWDSSTNLQYLRARWYDPSVGRFINKDTYEGDIANPLSLNLYVYVQHNPLRYLDPNGHKPVDWGLAGTGGSSFGTSGGAPVGNISGLFDVMNKAITALLGLGIYKSQETTSDSSSNSDSKVSQDEPKLTDAQLANVKKAEANLPHLDEKHLEAYERDLQGNPILKEDGTAWDHKTEVENASAGLKKAIKGLEGSMENPNLNPELRSRFEEIINNGKEILKKVEEIKQKYTSS